MNRNGLSFPARPHVCAARSVRRVPLRKGESPAIRVLLIDSPSVMRSALAALIRSEPGLSLAGETDNLKEILEICRQANPHVLLMEPLLRTKRGNELAELVRHEFPQKPLLVFSTSAREEDIWRASNLHVAGYLLKSVKIDQLFHAIRRVASGHPYFPSDVWKKFNIRLLRKNLTSRELQVLRQIAVGHSNKEIMADLHLSEGAVKLHVSNILSKMEVLDRTQAVIQAFRRGIISLDD